MILKIALEINLAPKNKVYLGSLSSESIQRLMTSFQSKYPWYVFVFIEN